MKQDENFLPLFLVLTHTLTNPFTVSVCGFQLASLHAHAAGGAGQDYIENNQNKPT